jgi:hypothetical protein
VWIDTYVPQLADVDLQVSLKAPRRNGRRFLWQKCEFEYSGAGRYSCGFRTGRGQDASRYPGTWGRRGSDRRRERQLRELPGAAPG